MLHCTCRACTRTYREDKATADWKGYCSQKCIREKLKTFGYNASKVFKEGKVYRVLKAHDAIGSIKVGA
jgi:hypothetical protein